MRDRWRTVSGIWESNRAAANRMNLLGQLDYFGKLSSQLEWQRDPKGRMFRVVQTEAGQPTAALVGADAAIVDSTLYWIACKDMREAHYLLAVINSEVLYEAAMSLMAKGQFGARHLHKHLWKLPIPEFDPENPMHVTVSKAGEAAAEGVEQWLHLLRQERDRVTVTIARREIRNWLKESTEGQSVEDSVTALFEGS